MKRFIRLGITLLLAVVLLTSLAAPAFAANTWTGKNFIVSADVSKKATVTIKNNNLLTPLTFTRISVSNGSANRKTFTVLPKCTMTLTVSSKFLKSASAKFSVTDGFAGNDINYTVTVKNGATWGY